MITRCKQGPDAAHDSGPRRARDIRLVVVHSAEGSDDVAEDTTAEAVARYFARQDVEASTQLAVDRDSCVRMLPDLVIPWGAPGANSNGVHIELAGWARWTREEWLKRQSMLTIAAEHAAMWCWQYRIPRRWVGPVGLRLRRSGLTTHADVNRVFKRSAHWDPGPGFPKDVFLGMVRVEYKRIVESRRASKKARRGRG